jgi:hypothetical protein
VDLVVLIEQELGEIRAVLARDAGDERFFHADVVRRQATPRARRGASSRAGKNLPGGDFQPGVHNAVAWPWSGS